MPRRDRDADDMLFPRTISRVNVRVFFCSCTDQARFRADGTL
ncbi:hypothetical protein C7S17_1772 [Burkholderia thailandensis]|nr:hypothetical protein [Burkholderia thailandensis]